MFILFVRSTQIRLSSLSNGCTRYLSIFFLYLPIYIMTYLSFYQFIYQHNYQHICLSVYIFTSLYIYLSIYLSIFIYLFLPTLLFIYFANLYILLFFHSSSTFSPKSKIYRLVCFNLIILYAQLYCI